MLSTRARLRFSRIYPRCSYSAVATPPVAAPSLLTKVRNDMKNAMKAKDSFRLDVLRGLISEVTNAAKTSKPVTTDSQMLNIIRKHVKSSEAAAGEFSNAKRDELKDREVAQIAVLQEYMKDSDIMGEEDVTKAIQDVIGNMRTDGKQVTGGSVMKALVGPGGSLDGQLVDKKDVARLVQGMI
ncbi:hypothetical protein MMC28_002482 [Mycoblastus sanguinarius]|nr:hypothetical protein [Mycoblastus sanguinarius]